MGDKPDPSTKIRRHRRPKRNRRWMSLLDPYEAGEYLVVPLNSTFELRDEAWHMHNCIGRNYPTWCKEGFIRIFSIRDLDGRRLATASIYFDFESNRWRIEQCKGYANVEVCWQNGEPSDLLFVVEDMIRLYQKTFDATGRDAP